MGTNVYQEKHDDQLQYPEQNSTVNIVTKGYNLYIKQTTNIQYIRSV